ncbi:MAG: hypothetical protein C0524_07415 [Rhodobacter sp.]|nr:hypothetical protein [Rhodobacter sp.]
MAAMLSVLSTAAGAQAFRAESMVHSGPANGAVPVQATVSDPELILLLSGLAKIESDLQLGMLFLQDGLSNAEGSHFAEPRVETYPNIKEGLVKAGIADFEALLVALEAGGDKATVTAAYTEAITAIMRARSTLRPSAQDMLTSIVDQARAVADEMNPAGPTELQNYQDAWAMLMVARTQVDLLSRSQDAAIIEAAREMVSAFDNIIIEMPDPNAGGAVAFDPAPLLEVITRLERLAGSV